jgi:hypothetical protein
MRTARGTDPIGLKCQNTHRSFDVRHTPLRCGDSRHREIEDGAKFPIEIFESCPNGLNCLSAVSTHAMARAALPTIITYSHVATNLSVGNLRSALDASQKSNDGRRRRYRGSRLVAALEPRWALCCRMPGFELMAATRRCAQRFWPANGRRRINNGLLFNRHASLFEIRVGHVSDVRWAP